MLIVLSFVVFRIKHQPCPFCPCFVLFLTCWTKGIETASWLSIQRETWSCQRCDQQWSVRSHSPVPNDTAQEQFISLYYFLFSLIFYPHLDANKVNVIGFPERRKVQQCNNYENTPNQLITTKIPVTWQLVVQVMQRRQLIMKLSLSRGSASLRGQQQALLLEGWAASSCRETRKITGSGVIVSK